jgi:hypothetical protein
MLAIGPSIALRNLRIFGPPPPPRRYLLNHIDPRSPMGKLLFFSCLCAALLTIGCDSATDNPDADETGNTLGGETAVDFAEKGDTFSLGLWSEPYIAGLANLRDSVVITSNENGIVTTFISMRFDSTFARALDTALGIENLPTVGKNALIETFRRRFGATIDTADKAKMRIEFTTKTKVTTEGIQEFMSSGGDLSKPFTVVKYGSNVGDRYTFTDTDGNNLVREVTYKSTSDDYQFGFINIKVVKVDQTGFPGISRATFYANHRFGLVNVDVVSQAGKKLEMGVYPW